MPGAICPGCGSWSRRIHGSYLRFPADVPSGGRRVALCLRVRRFLCPVISCGRRTFAEQAWSSYPGCEGAGWAWPPGVRCQWRSRAIPISLQNGSRASAASRSER
ncbi:transposase family protein [Streptomyces sp. NPDC056708]|uniref:transposase family protein n=1 Tax=unclassified Streptomyces TaxID=2593676 RepID=UPI003679B538